MAFFFKPFLGVFVSIVQHEEGGGQPNLCLDAPKRYYRPPRPFPYYRRKKKQTKTLSWTNTTTDATVKESRAILYII